MLIGKRAATALNPKRKSLCTILRGRSKLFAEAAGRVAERKAIIHSLRSELLDVDARLADEAAVRHDTEFFEGSQKRLSRNERNKSTISRKTP